MPNQDAQGILVGYPGCKCQAVAILTLSYAARGGSGTQTIRSRMDVGVCEWCWGYLESDGIEIGGLFGLARPDDVSERLTMRNNDHDDWLRSHVLTTVKN